MQRETFERMGRLRLRSSRLLAKSAAMLVVVEEVEGLSAVNVPVLIRGESGTGKELIARALHEGGPRGARELVAVNCAAFPDGLLETELFGHARGAFTGAHQIRNGLLAVADGGTLFLDEVADLPARAQTSLLRVLQERQYRRVGESGLRSSDFRLVSATHKCLEREVEAGRFREDLFFRINVVQVHVPPLRERPEDIPPLAQHFLRQQASLMSRDAPRLSSKAEAALMSYRWPGNARELDNEMIRALIRAGSGRVIDVAHLSVRIGQRGLERAERQRLKSASASFERRLLRETLAQHGGNRTRAASALGLSRQGLYQKLKRLGVRSDV